MRKKRRKQNYKKGRIVSDYNESDGQTKWKWAFIAVATIAIGVGAAMVITQLT